MTLAFALPLAAYLAVILALLAASLRPVGPSDIAAAFRDPAVMAAAWLSLKTSLLGVAIALAVGIPAAWLLSRHGASRLVRALDTVVDLPIVLPPLVLGLLTLIFFGTGLGRAFDGACRTAWNLLSGDDSAAPFFVYQVAGIVFVQAVTGCAFSIRVLKAGYDGLDPRYGELATLLGASPWLVFLRVTLPLLRPSIVAAAALTWAHVIGLFGPVIVVSGTMRGRTEILPTTIFLEVSVGNIEAALVVSAMMVLASFAVLFVLRLSGVKVIC